jgi:hypothetical protein
LVGSESVYCLELAGVIVVLPLVFVTTSEYLTVEQAGA